MIDLIWWQLNRTNTEDGETEPRRIRTKICRFNKSFVPQQTIFFSFNSSDLVYWMKWNVTLTLTPAVKFLFLLLCCWPLSLVLAFDHVTIVGNWYISDVYHILMLSSFVSSGNYTEFSFCLLHFWLFWVISWVCGWKCKNCSSTCLFVFLIGHIGQNPEFKVPGYFSRTNEFLDLQQRKRNANPFIQSNSGVLRIVSLTIYLICPFWFFLLTIFTRGF